MEYRPMQTPPTNLPAANSAYMLERVRVTATSMAMLVTMSPQRLPCGSYPSLILLRELRCSCLPRSPGHSREE